MKGIVIKIKEGKEDVWREWCKRIKNEHYEQAIETLREEMCARIICDFSARRLVVYHRHG